MFTQHVTNKITCHKYGSKTLFGSIWLITHITGIRIQGKYILVRAVKSFRKKVTLEVFEFVHFVQHET